MKIEGPRYFIRRHGVTRCGFGCVAVMENRRDVSIVETWSLRDTIDWQQRAMFQCICTDIVTNRTEHNRSKSMSTFLFKKAFSCCATRVRRGWLEALWRCLTNHRRPTSQDLQVHVLPSNLNFKLNIDWLVLRKYILNLSLCEFNLLALYL